MSKVEKLDLMGVASLAAVTAALLVAWMVASHGRLDNPARVNGPEKAVTLTEDGRMKLTVTADAGTTEAAPARTARTASVGPSAGPSLQVALPVVFRP